MTMLSKILLERRSSSENIDEILSKFEVESKKYEDRISEIRKAKNELEERVGKEIESKYESIGFKVSMGNDGIVSARKIIDSENFNSKLVLFTRPHVMITIMDKIIPNRRYDYDLRIGMSDKRDSVELLRLSNWTEFQRAVKSFSNNFSRSLRKYCTPDVRKDVAKYLAPYSNRTVRGISQDYKLNSKEFLEKYGIPDVKSTTFSGKRGITYDKEVSYLSERQGVIERIRKAIDAKGAPTRVEKYKEAYKDQDELEYSSKHETEFSVYEIDGVKLTFKDGTTLKFYP